MSLEFYLFIVVKRYGVWYDLFDSIVLIESARWLLMPWCPSGTRASATIVMTEASGWISEVSQENEIRSVTTKIVADGHVMKEVFVKWHCQVIWSNKLKLTVISFQIVDWFRR